MSGAQQRRIGSSVYLNLAIIIIGLLGITALLVTQLLASDEEGTVPSSAAAIELELVVSDLESPVLLVGDGGGDRFVVEQAGRIQRLTAEDEIGPEPLLDISGRVSYGGERGLLGLAFHPGFAENGRFFVDYTHADDGAVTISEFVLAEGETVVDPAGERVLLTIPQPYGNHNGGMVAFDHEGMLLIGVGDGGSANDPHGAGQDRASLLGTLLRIDVDRGWPYATPVDNGFADDREARPEIHAVGLRNPWRFSVDRSTGHVYIGDVGQGRFEEVNVLAPGARTTDFGWSEMEGMECFDGRACDPAAHTFPVLAYPHVGEDASHCSIIGGYAYRGEAGTLPDGTYLYADYCSGTIWSAPAEGLAEGQAEATVVGRLRGRGHGQVTSFGEDDAGELYLLTSGGHVLAVTGAETTTEPTAS